MGGNRRLSGYFQYMPSTNHSINSVDETPEVSGDWDTRLPSRIFATDRYPEGRINVYSKPDTLSFVCDALRGKPAFQTLMESSFGPLFSLPVIRCPTSCKLLHSLLCRQLVSRKKYELWTVFGGQPLRYSLVCDRFDDDYDPDVEFIPEPGKTYYWDELIGDRQATLGDVGKLLKACGEADGERALRLALILIVDGVLIASHQIGRPTFKYVEMLKDINEFLSFPWGRESFMKTIDAIKPGKKTGKGDPVKLFTQQLQQKTFRLSGFPAALQLLAFNNIAGLAGKVVGGLDTTDFRQWLSVKLPKQSIALSEVHMLERDPELAVVPYIVTDEDESCFVWDDEIIDRKITHMMELISQDHVFGKPEWPGGNSSLPVITIVEKKPNTVHEKHVVLRKKKSGASLGVKKGSSKSKKKSRELGVKKGTRHTLLDDDPNEWLSRELQSLKQEVQTLKARTSKIENKFKAHKSYCSQKFHTLSACRSSNQKRRKLESQTFRMDENNNDIKDDLIKSASSPRLSEGEALQNPQDFLYDGVKHDWDQYVHVFGDKNNNASY